MLACHGRKLAVHGWAQTLADCAPGQGPFHVLLCYVKSVAFIRQCLLPASGGSGNPSRTATFRRMYHCDRKPWTRMTFGCGLLS